MTSRPLGLGHVPEYAENDYTIVPASGATDFSHNHVMDLSVGRVPVLQYRDTQTPMLEGTALLVILRRPCWLEGRPR